MVKRYFGGVISATSPTVAIGAASVFLNTTQALTSKQQGLLASVPDAPTGVSATANAVGGMAVSFTAPANNGGSAITAYNIVSSPGNFTATGASSPINITGLANNTGYTFTAYAINTLGISRTGATSSSVSTWGVPGAPTITQATPLSASASIAFSAPASNGGTAITSYTVVSSPGNFTASGASSPLTVTGLTNGTPYTFTVYATNAVGAGPASSASSPVSPVSLIVDILVVGGGGAGSGNGSGTSNAGGGGGGGVVYSTNVLPATATTYTITVGGGGTGGSTTSGDGRVGNPGSPSSFIGGSISLSAGGGAGGAYSGFNGGTSGTPQANKGNNQAPSTGVGGGGAGAYSTSAAGGAGYDLGATATTDGWPSRYYGGGGGGVGTGAGGSGGGGTGAVTYASTNGTAGTNYLGGGGGAGSGTTQPSGGIGVVVVKIPASLTPTTTGSPTITTTGSYKFYKFTASGTIVF